MAATPQITLRVPKDVLDSWKKVCEENDTSVSEKIRELMNNWVESQS